MKATIKADGTLCIEPETELEQYALTCWLDDNTASTKALVNPLKLVVSLVDFGKSKLHQTPFTATQCMICGREHVGLQCPNLTPRAVP